MDRDCIKIFKGIIENFLYLFKEKKKKRLNFNEIV